MIPKVPIRVTLHSRTEEHTAEESPGGPQETMKKIQYSVSMRANGMNENDPKRAYASLQLTGKVTLNELAEHMAAHNTVFSRGTIVGILTEMTACSRELLLQGYSIELGEMGTLTPSLKSKGAESLSKFTVDNITTYRAIFRNGKALKNLRHDAQFERTTTRKAHAITLKAQTEGQESADWSGLPAVTPVTPEP